MSDTESVRGDTSEEEVEEMEEEEIVMNGGETQTMMKNESGAMVMVITRNVKVSGQC